MRNLLPSYEDRLKLQENRLHLFSQEFKGSKGRPPYTWMRTIKINILMASLKPEMVWNRYELRKSITRADLK